MKLCTPVLVCAAAFACAAAGGDRHPSEHRVFPPDAFVQAGRGRQLVDVTKPPFNAKGDGVTDDTAALCKAMRFIREMNPLYTQTNGNVFCCQSHKANWAIYLPRGTYRVTDTISQGWPALGINKGLGWSDIRPMLVLDGRHDSRLIELEKSTGVDESYFAEANWAIRIVGESRDDTVIRLDDNAAGFGKGAKKAVLAFCLLTKGSNVNLGNFLENVTIDAGDGNPGAVGVRWNSSNFGGVRNVTIRAKGGEIGLDMGYRNACGYLRDVTIDGFSAGLDLSAGSETIVVLEHSTIRNADIAFAHHDSYHGVFDLLNVRKVELEEVGTPWRPAKGFRVTVKDCAFAADTRAGLIPVEDVPAELYPELDDIATPEEFGAKGDGETDDTEAIRRAFSSGKKAVYFLGAAYSVAGPIDVPAHIDCIDGMHSYLGSAIPERKGVFNVTGRSPRPLEIRRFYFRNGILIDHTADRVLSVSDVFTEFPPARMASKNAPSWYTYRNATPSLRKRVFATGCVQFCPEPADGSNDALENISLQARLFNNETSSTSSIMLRNCRALFLGVKGENSHTYLDMVDSTIDMYGLTYLQWSRRNHWKYPVIKSSNSHYSIDGYFWRLQPMQPILFREMARDGGHFDQFKSDFPQKDGEDGFEAHFSCRCGRCRHLLSHK